MMKNTFLALIALLVFLTSCNPSPENPERKIKTGTWLGELSLNDSTTLSFLYELGFDDGQIITVHNGEEKIQLEIVFDSIDSLVLNFPVYQSRLCVQRGDEIWIGYFEKLDSKTEYRVPFVGSYGFEDRLLNTEKACCPLPERWKVEFKSGDIISPAIGEFKLTGNKVTGTFLTESGDYRFLEGKLNGNVFTLFGFDGGYLQVFKATLQNDTLHGDYFSGLTGYKTWLATPNDTFNLQEPEVISELNTEIDSISFSYPGIDGSPVSYNTHAYKNQVVLMQITGSWCPNCKDQARYLQQLKNEFSSQGLEIIGIAFERMGTLEASLAAAKKSKDDLGTDYRVGVAKYNREQVAEEVFPVVKKIRSYPTLIIIDKKGTVRRIHTGFAGPGTTRYEEATNSLTQFIKDLLDE